MVLEAHYKVIFEQNSDEANSFLIKDLIVNTVYGSLTRDCNSDYTFNLKTSVQYLEEGAP